MSITEEIRSKVRRAHLGEPFTNERFLKLGSRPAVDKAMSRLVLEGAIKRVSRGVFVRPKTSPFIGQVMPDVNQVVETIAKSHGEVIQVHGSVAASRFKISTQVPTKPVYYTSGSTREISVGHLKVKLMHTSSRRKLQFAGKKVGLALTALWYLGEPQVSFENIEKIRQGLGIKEFNQLLSASMPAWMSSALRSYQERAVA